MEAAGVLPPESGKPGRGFNRSSSSAALAKPAPRKADSEDTTDDAVDADDTDDGDDTLLLTDDDGDESSDQLPTDREDGKRTPEIDPAL